MKKSLIASTEQAKGIISGSITMFYDLIRPQPVNEPMVLYCPKCNAVHEDVGEWFAREHKTHLCLSCNELFRPKDTPTTGIKPMYDIGAKVYIREKWIKGCIWDGESDMPPTEYMYFDTKSVYENDWHNENADDGIGNIPWKSASIMPKEAARTWIEITSVNCLRVQDVHRGDYIMLLSHMHDSIYGNILWLNYEDGYTWFENASDSYKSFHIKRYGQPSWDNNDYIFLYEFHLLNNKNEAIINSIN